MITDLLTGDDFLNHVNQDSIQVLGNAYVEADLAERRDAGGHFQFVRLGYFIKDQHSNEGQLVFNRPVDLKERWRKT